MDLGDGGPLAERLRLGQALTDPQAHPPEVGCTRTGAPLRQPVEGGGEGEPGREQQGELLGHDRELEEELPLPPLGGDRHLLLLDQEGERRTSEDEGQADDRVRAHGQHDQGPGTEAGDAVAHLTNAERRHVE